MAKKKKLNMWMILGGIIALVIIFKYQQTGQLFAFVGQDCEDFRTNAVDGVYNDVNVWIAADSNEDGNYEAYGYKSVVKLQTTYAATWDGYTPEGHPYDFYDDGFRLRIKQDKDDSFASGDYWLFEKKQPAAANANLICGPKKTVYFRTSTKMYNTGWIAVDCNNDGVLEAYGYNGHTTQDFVLNDGNPAPGGQSYLCWDETTVRVKAGSGNELYKIGDQDAVAAITYDFQWEPYATDGNELYGTAPVEEEPECTVDTDCDDGVSSTTDTCDAGVCKHTTQTQTGTVILRTNAANPTSNYRSSSLQIVFDYDKDGTFDCFTQSSYYTGFTVGTKTPIATMPDGKKVYEYQTDKIIVRDSYNTIFSKKSPSTCTIPMTSVPTEPYASEGKEVYSSTTTPPPSCTEDWVCTEWGACTNSQQTRQCNDLNSCGTTINKPALTQSCTPACVPVTETCNGVDDDCDGLADEGCNTCVNYATCTQVTLMGTCPSTPTEVCNSKDDNCNGQVDEGLLTTCTNYNTCETYDQCSSTCPTKPTEICDGKDNDCDGDTDEGCSCTSGATKSCGTSNVGLCEYGTQTCVSGQWAACSGNVEPVVETCNDNKDNDCDGEIDENCTTGCTTNSECDDGNSATVDSCVNGTCQFVTESSGDGDGTEEPKGDKVDLNEIWEKYNVPIIIGIVMLFLLMMLGGGSRR